MFRHLHHFVKSVVYVVLLTVGIFCLWLCFSYDPIQFHKNEMQRAKAAMEAASELDPSTNLVMYSYGDNLQDYENHRAALVGLGAVTELFATLDQIDGNSPEAKHLARRLVGSNEEQWGGPPCIDCTWTLHTPTFTLTVWCYSEHANDWHNFIRTLNSDQYTQKFM